MSRGPYSCDELGMCQERFPRCGGCRVTNDTERVHARVVIDPQPRQGSQALLAPGVVEGYRVGFFGSAAQRRELRRWVVPAVALVAVCALAGLAAGLKVGWLP